MSTPDYDGTGEPGSLVIPAALHAPRPQPTDTPGDMAAQWLKVGGQGIGGNGEFSYGNSYYGGDSGIWKQT